MVTVKKVRLVNPQKKSRGRHAARAAGAKRKGNPGPLYVLGALNPNKGEKHVTAKKSKKKKNAARKSPMARAINKHHSFQKSFKAKKKYKRNPELSATLKQPVEFLKFGLIALLGLVATRQVPQMALGAKNTSWAGYLANMATAVAGAYGTGKFAGPRAALAFGTGGGLYTVNRILTDKLTPVGQVLSLSGVGDPMAARTLGRVVPGAVYPPTYDSKGNLVLPPAFIAAMRTALPAPSTNAPAPRLSGTTARIAA